MNIAKLRLQNQLLPKPAPQSVEDVVRRMGAVQAQDYLASLWGIGVRLSGVTEADVEQAAADHKIVRTWPKRGTLHWVAGEDVRWMLEHFTPRVIASSAGRHRQLELTDEVFEQCRELICTELEGGKQYTRQEIYQSLEEANISTTGQRGYHILVWLAQKGIICFGPRRGKQHTFVLLEEWIPEGIMMDREKALEELALRYVRSHGPVTEYDFAGWAGLTITDARASFDRIKTEVASSEFDGQTYWFSESSEMDASTAYLLPAFDEMLSGYKDRANFIDSDRKKSLILKNGIISASIVVDCTVAGTWKRTLNNKSIHIEIDLFTDLGNAERNAISQAAELYGKFLRLSASIAI